MEIIEKKIIINATPNIVLFVLFSDHYYAKWANVLKSRSKAQSSWNLNEDITYISEDATVKGTIIEKINNQRLSVIFGDAPNQYVESYVLTRHKETTELRMQTFHEEHYFNESSTSWDLALLQVKEIAESMYSSMTMLK